MDNNGFHPLRKDAIDIDNGDDDDDDTTHESSTVTRTSIESNNCSCELSVEMSPGSSSMTFTSYV